MSNGNICVLSLNVAIVLFVSPWWLLASVPPTIGYFVLYSQSDGEKMKTMLTTIMVINLITILLPFPFWVWLIDLVVSVLIATNYEPDEDPVQSTYSDNQTAETQCHYGNTGGYSAASTRTSYQPNYGFNKTNTRRVQSSTNSYPVNSRPQNYPVAANTSNGWADAFKEEAKDWVKGEVKDWVKGEVKDWAKGELKERTGVDLDADDFGIPEVKRRYNQRHNKSNSNDEYNQNDNYHSHNRNNGSGHSYGGQYGSSYSSHTDYNHHGGGYYDNGNYSSNGSYSSHNDYSSQGGGYYDNSSYSSSDDYSSYDDD